MKKKFLVISLLIVIIINFISSVSYAEITTEDLLDEEGAQELLGGDDILSNLNNGQAGVVDNDGNNQVVKVSVGKNIVNTIFSIITRVLTPLPQIGSYVLSSAIVTIEEDSDTDSIFLNWWNWIWGTDGSTYTVYDTVMGEYRIFNFDFIDNKYEGVKAEVPLSYQIKENMRNIYYTLRDLSIGALLFILIYIGIRMAISTTAPKKAKYKKMFFNWLVSFILVFFMHYIIMALSYISSFILELIKKFADSMGLENLELNIMKGKVKDLSGKSGFNLITTLLTIWYLVYIQIKFFIMYTKRFCETTLLVMVSPLVTITYSIDKAGDNKAQAFNAWLKELVMKVSIQIIHAMIYCLFMLSAGIIAQEAPLIALIFFTGLARTEKIVRNLFDVKGDMLEQSKVPFVD